MDLALCLYRYQPYGGLERNFRAVAEILLERGHRVRALARSLKGELPAELERIALPNRAWTNPGSDRRFARDVARELARRPAECVLGFNRLPGLDLFYAADPCFRAGRGQRSWLARAGPRERVRAEFERALFDPRADTEALVLTEREREAYAASYGTPLERLHVVPPSLEPRFLDPPVPREASRHSLGLDPGAAVLLHLGSDFQRKGLDRTVAALAALPSELRARVELLVAGRGSAGPIQRQAARAGVEGALRFLGPVDDPRPLFGAADLLVHPAREENTGGVLLEALAQGLPVVTSAAPGFAEHVRRAGGGVVLAEPFRVNDLTCALRELLEDEPRRRAAAKAARSYPRGTPLGGRAEVIADLVEAWGRARGHA